jgi:catechol 2,3-dioxygenase-like lactoylglutathione lyase family enzyme
MPIAAGINHIATLTPSLERHFAFYEAVFEAVKTFEMAKADDHPRMWIYDLGGGSALNVFEAEPGTIVGDRRQAGGRGPIDHFGIHVDSRATLETVLDRLVAAGADVGEIQDLGGEWSLFFRDLDGMELEVTAPIEG